MEEEPQVTPVPGATSYYWTFGGLSTTQANPSTVPYLDLTAPSGGGCSNCSLSVTAQSGGACTNATSIPINFRIGSGDPYITTPYNSQTEVCANTEVDFVANVGGQRGQITDYIWTVTGGTLLYGQHSPYARIRTPAYGAWVDVQVDIINSCGDLRAYSGVQSVTMINGEYCPMIEYSQATTAYPNPTDGELTVLTLKTALTLYNAHGKPVLRQNTEGRKTIHLSTRDLPAGIYYLDRGDGQRQRIQIVH